MNRTDLAGVPWTPTALRRPAFLAGALHVVTFVALILLAAYFPLPIVDDPRYILGVGQDTQVPIGALVDIVNPLASIATAVVLYQTANALLLGTFTDKSRLLPGVYLKAKSFRPSATNPEFLALGNPSSASAVPATTAATL